MYADSVQFNFAFHWDHKALASVNYECFHKIGTFRIYVDYNIRGFDLESFCIGDVGSNQRGFFPGCDLVLFIK